MSSNDPLAPQSSVDEGLAGLVACVTVITRHLVETARIYESVIEMARFDITTAPGSDD